MVNTSNIDPNNPLSPSELILLNGDQFAKKVMMGNIQLMHTDASVSYSQLAEAMLTAAVLSVESCGNISFEVRNEKAMLGIRKVKALYGLPTSNPDEWPQYSLESQLVQIAKKLAGDGESSKISDLIYIWLRQDSSSPWQSAIEMVQSGLAERGLLDATETTKLKVFKKVNYSLPESAAELASQLPTDPIRNLLGDCEKNRKEVWELVIKEIKKAIKQRTEQDDVDFD
ncbi:MAG: hypothetical protein ACK2UM_01565 [Anaerolineales bacterium]|jgi:hypothetical protein